MSNNFASAKIPLKYSTPQKLSKKHYLYSFFSALVKEYNLVHMERHCPL